MSGSADHDPSVARAIRLERNWATVCIAIIAALILVTAYAGIHQATMPQTVVETIDPTRLHLSGEFTEANLGSELRPDGTVLVRAIGQQYSFTPPCIMVPADTPVRFHDQPD